MNQATNQAISLMPKTVPGVLVQIGYSAHLLVPSSVVGTLVKILEQAALVQENRIREIGELLVLQSGDGFKMKLGTFHVHTQEQYEEFRRLEDVKREAEKKAAAAEANNDVD
jgi:hypothetical protein